MDRIWLFFEVYVIMSAVYQNLPEAAKAFRHEVIGDCILFNADCLAVLPTLGKVDAVVTDPPYGIGFAAQPTRYQRANGMARRSWDNEAPQAAVEAAISTASHSVVWGGNYFNLPPSRGWLVWSKTGNAPSMADVEMAWTSVDMNARSFEKSVKSASLEKDLQSAAHPSQKPVGLMEFSICALPQADTVLDPFMGSGTTGVACVKLGRKFIGIEIDEGYFEIACERIRKAYAQPDFFVAQPKPEPAKQESLFGGEAA